ncbi:MAG: hypothetical protein MHMPM18_001330 [Marteilia pararefringens]
MDAIQNLNFLYIKAKCSRYLKPNQIRKALVNIKESVEKINYYQADALVSSIHNLFANFIRLIYDKRADNLIRPQFFFTVKELTSENFKPKIDYTINRLESNEVFPKNTRGEREKIISALKVLKTVKNSVIRHLDKLQIRFLEDLPTETPSSNNNNSEL